MTVVDPLTGLSQLKLGLSKPVETEIIPLKKHVISSDHAWKHGSRAHEAWLKKKHCISSSQSAEMAVPRHSWEHLGTIRISLQHPE